MMAEREGALDGEWIGYQFGSAGFLRVPSDTKTCQVPHAQQWISAYKSQILYSKPLCYAIRQNCLHVARNNNCAMQSR